VISFEQFCSVLKDITDYGRSPEDLEQWKESQDIPREEILAREFGRIEPPKPQFGRALAEEIDPEEIPDDLRDVIDRCRQIQ